MDRINFEGTGGMVGVRRRLGTMTIHAHDNGRFYVTDDWQNGRTRSAGHASIEDAVKANKPLDDYRLIPRAD